MLPNECLRARDYARNRSAPGAGWFSVTKFGCSLTQSMSSANIKWADIECATTNNQPTIQARATTCKWNKQNDRSVARDVCLVPPTKLEHTATVCIEHSQLIGSKGQSLPTTTLNNSFDRFIASQEISNLNSKYCHIVRFALDLAINCNGQLQIALAFEFDWSDSRKNCSQCTC